MALGFTKGVGGRSERSCRGKEEGERRRGGEVRGSESN